MKTCTCNQSSGKQRARLRRTSLSLLILIAMLTISPPLGFTEWRDLGTLSKFSGKIKTTCAYRLVWTFASGNSRRTVQFPMQYFWKNVSATLEAIVPGYFVSEMMSSSLLESEVADPDQIDTETPHRLFLHIESRNNFGAIRPKGKTDYLDDLYLKSSKFRLQANCG